MNIKKIIALEQTIHDDYNNIAGIVVQKDGKIIYENYFNACTATSKIHIASVTKSIISALIGIAIDQGYIKSVDQSVLDFFPNFIIQEGERTIQNITLKHLLTMTAPYKYSEEPYKEFFASENWVTAALDLLGGNGQIGTFRYTPLIGPDILSGILVTTTGQSVLDFATKNLFSPLGIKVKHNIVLPNKDAHLDFLKNTNVDGWVVDPQGVNTAAWGLTLTAIELSKIGLLYLQNGQYERKQIVSSSWIKETTKKQSQWHQLAYGYLWWVNDEHTYAAMGDGGNIIYVNTAKKLVISIASLFIPNAKDRIIFIKKYLEPTFGD